MPSKLLRKVDKVSRFFDIVKMERGMKANERDARTFHVWVWSLASQLPRGGNRRARGDMVD